MSVKDALDAECHLRARVREETADPEWALREFVSLAANGSAISSGGALCLKLSVSMKVPVARATRRPSASRISPSA